MEQGKLELGGIWAKTQGHLGVCIAILDGPVDCSHPCLSHAALTQVRDFRANALNKGLAAKHPSCQYYPRASSKGIGTGDWAQDLYLVMAAISQM